MSRHKTGSKNILSSWLIGPATLAMILSVAPACGDDDAKAGGPPGGGKGGPRPALVKVAQTRAGSLKDTWRYLGQVRAKQSVTLSTAVSGEVLTVTGRVGDPLTKGELVVTLSTDLLEPQRGVALAEVHRLSAQLGRATREFKRVKTLAETIVTKAERDRFQTEVSTLRAQLRGARAAVSRIDAEMARHTIAATFDGVVAKRHVEPGAWVTVGTPLLDVVSVQDLEIIADVTPTLRPHIQVGGAVTLKGATPVEARIVGILDALAPTTRTMRVRIEPVTRPVWLVPNASVEVAFPLAISDAADPNNTESVKAVLVSRDAVTQGPSGARLVRVVDGAAEQVPVEIIATAQDEMLVRANGLVAGDTVIVRGNERLRPGQPIKIIADGPPGGPPGGRPSDGGPPKPKGPPK
ncbi:MAG: RND family efflux transporter MFP subunit [Myxococcota bacterium]|jgi:RND family efflux transporter MFP subunit